MEKKSEVVNFNPTISAQETKQTNKESNLLTLTVSCEKMSCLIRSKKKKQDKPKQQQKKIKKLIKMIMEAII